MEEPLKMRRKTPLQPRFPFPDGKAKTVMALFPYYELPEHLKEGAPKGVIYFPFLAEVIQKMDLEKLQAYLRTPDQKNIEYVDPYTGTTVIHLSAKYPSQRLWDLLSNHWLLPRYLEQADERGITPLMAACWYDNPVAVRVLLAKGADTNRTTSDHGSTALHYCACQDRTETCQMVLSDGRCKKILEATGSDGYTPLAVAVVFGSPAVDPFIEAGASILGLNPVTGRNNFHTAIAFDNYDFLKFVLGRLTNKEELERKDINGDTPLSLAIRMGKPFAVQIILKHPAAETLVQNCRDLLHELVADNKYRILRIIADHVENDHDFYDVFDSEGRTPLLLAIELKHFSVLQILTTKGVDFTTLNCYTGDSVFHVAAYSQDQTVFEQVLKDSSFVDLSKVENNLGLTPYDIILGHSNFIRWKAWTQLTYEDARYQNSTEESTLFIAAKEGNYILVLALLLSHKFYSYFEVNTNLREEDLMHLEVKRLVYASDVFIIFGLLSEQRGWETVPKQDHLFKKNAKGMNIFHAAAIGGNLDCIRFLNNYHILYKKGNRQMDMGDENGNSPLFYATLYERIEVVKYLLLQGCDLYQGNVLGWTPLHSIAASMKLVEELGFAINHCVSYSSHDKKNQRLVLSFKLFQTSKDNQMHVVAALFQNLKPDHHIELLTNPVIEYFVLYKWFKIKKMVAFKLFINVIMVSSFTLFLTFKLCSYLSGMVGTASFFRFVSILFASLLLIFNIPIIFFRNSHYLVYLLAPLLILVYFYSKSEGRENIELAAVAVLLSWLTMISESHVTKMSYQIAVLQKTVHAVLQLYPLVILVMTAFSVCFFILFHEYYEYNNPLHAFFSMAIHMKEGDVKIPSIPSDEEFEPLDHSHVPIMPPWGSSGLKILQELRSLLIEGSLLFAFRIFVIICAYNLLVDAAIQGVIEADKMGTLQKIKIYVQELYFWETLLNSKFFRYLSSLHLSWIVGIPPTLREDMRIPSEVDPTENVIPDFDLTSLQWILRKNKAPFEPCKFFISLDHVKERKIRKSMAKTSLNNISRETFRTIFMKSSESIY